MFENRDMRFSFIHAADLHIDSPLAALGKRNADAAALFAHAGRKAVEALIDETLNSGAAFLVIAGDVFDGAWNDYTTGLFFIRELGRLEREGIPVFMVRGNHDAESKMSRALRNWPSNVHLFSSRKAESKELPELQTILHGRSFPGPKVPDDFVASYPAAKPGWLNIGILHTALDGVRGHASYAPCTPDDLRRFGYEYWALGHIHMPEIVSRDPWIVFPGNIQGRSVRETGPRGAMRVDVEDGRIAGTGQVALDQARWALDRLDITACTSEDSLYETIGERLRGVHDKADGRPLALRLILDGESVMHGWIAANKDQVEAETQALAAHIAGDFWLEKLHIATSAQHQPAASWDDDQLDVKSLLVKTASAPAFSQTIATLAADIRSKLPPELREAFDVAVEGEGESAMPVGGEAQALVLGRLKQDASG